MKTLGSIIVTLSGLLCMIALAISTYPGVLSHLAFFAVILSFMVVPAVAVIGLITLVWLARRGHLRRVVVPWKQIGASLLMFFITLVLLEFYIPRRIAFAASRSAFQRFPEQVSLSGDGPVAVNEFLGVYHVDKYSADHRGGTYYRVFSAQDGVGPDNMSYGFSYNPNAKGTPFGAAYYRTFRLGGGWYWFRVSDDWY